MRFRVGQRRSLMSRHHRTNDFLSLYLYCCPDILLRFVRRLYSSKIWIFQFLEKTETLKFLRSIKKCRILSLHGCISYEAATRQVVRDVNRYRTSVIFPRPLTLIRLIRHRQRNYVRDYLHHGMVVRRITRSKLR